CARRDSSAWFAYW
nr:immunoglobulin heavy chain junction region [Mus musculus]